MFRDCNSIYKNDYLISIKSIFYKYYIIVIMYITLYIDIKYNYKYINWKFIKWKLYIW